MRWSSKGMPSQQGKTVLITGANSGLGFQTSLAFARAGAKVVMACRNPAKADQAVQDIRGRCPQAELELQQLDLASLSSVRAGIESVTKKHTQLDVLVNNAGVMAVPQGLTEDGFEVQIGTNHFGHFALTMGLLPLLQKAQASRIVNLSSMAHRWTPGLNFDDLDWTSRRYNRWQAYGDSKLSNLLFCYELDRRLNGGSVKVVAAHPGFSDTHLQYVAAEQKNSKLEAGVMWLGNTLFAQSAERGALPSLYAATAEAVQSGEYFGPDGFQQTRGWPRKVGSNRHSRNEKAAARLWQVSEQRTGFSF